MEAAGRDRGPSNTVWTRDSLDQALFVGHQISLFRTANCVIVDSACHYEYMMTKCELCGGTGVDGGFKCTLCDGKGVKKAVNYVVTLNKPWYVCYGEPYARSNQSLISITILPSSDFLLPRYQRYTRALTSE
ncbi:hypothetical protein N7457_007221 [Penicillium paradoxum]|uniref:uncharacterized protein n=1 Tax=Penicillium paradoxum TaxID=176176 RepID=UPI00254910EB|nr:uncharacterized protein N7457_007221 [Penicillium paradoxum]KAJ5779501.1 hypothetical protein N7457_007221 [Penicillium paradoxum]